MEYVLGIDIGTGSTKAVAVDFYSQSIAVSQHHYQTYSPRSGTSEQDPELIWQALQACLIEVHSKLKCCPAAICFSSAMHSLIPVDKQGKKLMNMITWADSRSDYVATRLKASPGAIRMYESSGMPLHAMSPLCKIIWLKENMPDVFDAAHKFISIKEFIWFRLFGEYVVDHSIACATGMLDLLSRTWNKDLLALAGITEDRLSRPVSTTYTRSGAQFLPAILEEGTPFVIGASDGCLANLGSFAIQRGVAAVTIGTSGAVRISSEKPIFNREAFTFSYCLDEDTFICGGPVNNGGNVLQWLVTNFLGKIANLDTFEEVFMMADGISPGSEGLLFLPYINGERAPVWDSNSSGAFVGVRSIHTQAHFCRAVLEGVCFALFEVLQAVESKSQEIRQINVSGGFVNSRLWMHLLADITGKDLILKQTEDASANGAAFMAMKVLGLNGGKYPAEAENAEEVIIKSDPEKHKLYSKNFAVYKSLYLGLKDSMHQLNNISY
ncbi:gluconokinase [Daejeonella lutea]|uniref:Gluconate kinase, FGGY family n=1 Tax=Daejeonella lutea TaxID=572036 RepID=A0A1T5F7E4_9SPHI|nr:gluconokinase [Daejeonella lutea]SKB92089.1 gluconate kinase, FGGY family [Daejeonella lutea]